MHVNNIKDMKTINYKITLVLLVIIALIFSCDTNETESVEQTIQETSIELKSSYGLLDISPNIYHDYFRQTDYSAGFSSLKANSLAEPSIVQRINISDDNNKTRNFSINNVSINSLTKAVKMSKVDGQNIYGKTISFKIGTTNKKDKVGNSSTETEVEMYIPDLVEITNPKIDNDDELLPICYYEDFVLEWNADPNNEEGLVVIAEYFGNNAIPENSTNEHILNTDVIDIDNGHAVLNNDLFKNIPNLSIVHLILLRGNVAIEEIEGELYKFYAESHVRLPIILAKDLTTVAKE